MLEREPCAEEATALVRVADRFVPVVRAIPMCPGCASSSYGDKTVLGGADLLVAFEVMES